MSSFGGLSTAVSGLMAQQRVLETIGHNIANAETDGYTRRRVDLAPAGVGSAPAVWSKTSAFGAGVQVKGITRMSDDILTSVVRRESALDGNASTTADIFSQLERLMPEPSDTGVAHQLSTFWNAWDDAAANPAARTALLQAGQNLATSFNQIATNVRGYHDNLQTTLQAQVAQVNTDAAKVADLNRAIVGALAGGGDAGDLQDQRDVLVERIISATGATTSTTADGAMNVYLGGGVLVRDGHSDALKVADTGALAPPLDQNGFQGLQVQWSADSIPLTSPGGSMAALLNGANNVVPGYLHQLDVVASNMVAGVNALHTTGHGMNTVTDINLNFFTPTGTTAATLSISSDIAGSPTKIALGAAGTGQLDGSLATQIAQIAESSTGPDSLHRTMIAQLANDVDISNNRTSVQSQILTQAKANRAAIAGVSIDEEMTNLVAAQHAYEASARVINAVDEMLDTLINRTGMVGR